MSFPGIIYSNFSFMGIKMGRSWVKNFPGYNLFPCIFFYYLLPNMGKCIPILIFPGINFITWKQTPTRRREEGLYCVSGF